MKRIVLLFVAAVVAVGGTVSAYGQTKKVAVYVTGNDAVNEIVASHLVDGLAHSGRYVAVERTAGFLKALTKEHGYERGGVVDDSEIAALGKQFGVQYVCVASVLTIWREKYVTARIIDVESAEVVATGCSTGSTATSSELVATLKRLSAALLSALDPAKSDKADKVAVYVSPSGSSEVDAILGDQLVAGFASSGRYLAVERTSSFLSQLAKEQGYQRSGTVDDEDIMRLGKQFGVRHVCVAKASQYQGAYFIAARLLDVESAEVVNSHNADNVRLSSVAGVLKVAQEIATKLSGRTIVEEKAFQTSEAKRRKVEEERAAFAKLMKKVTANVTSRSDEGDCLIGDLSGGGLLMKVWRNGNFYCGRVDGERHLSGMGMFVCAEGELRGCPGGTAYVGPFHDGYRHDYSGFFEDPIYGTVYGTDGKVLYYGNFKYGSPKDPYPTKNADSLYSAYTFGRQLYSDGSMYVGELKDGKRHGLGLYIWSDGGAYYGEWKENLRHGEGLFMTYEGEWRMEYYKDDKKQN